MTARSGEHEGSRRLILASQSPRRRALMADAGFTVDVVPPPVEEPGELGADLSPAQRAEALSYFKARSVVARVTGGVIIAGDTIAALGDRVFGKPVDRDDAREILLSLTGTEHEVITGVTLLDPQSDRRRLAHDRTLVTMRPMRDEELEAYLDSDAWKGKAGAYGIQDHGDAFVTSVRGSFSNVVGFPMELVTRLLGEWGFYPEQ